MKKLTTVLVIFVTITTFIGCSSEKTKKGRLIGQCTQKELTIKDKNNLDSLIFSNEVIVKVAMEKGDTIHAAIVKKDLEERVAKNDRMVDVVVDEPFNWIK